MIAQGKQIRYYAAPCLHYLHIHSVCSQLYGQYLINNIEVVAQWQWGPNARWRVKGWLGHVLANC